MCFKTNLMINTFACYLNSLKLYMSSGIFCGTTGNDDPYMPIDIACSHGSRYPYKGLQG